MKVQRGVLSSLILVILAVLLIIGFRYWGVTGRLPSEEAIFAGFTDQEEKCFIGIVDPDRANTNLAAEGFTCGESLRFLYSQPDAYTSPLLGGRGFKLNLPGGWSVEEKQSGGTSAWLTFARFSIQDGKYIAEAEKVSVITGITAAKDFEEFKKYFPASNGRVLGGFQALVNNQGIYVFAGNGAYWHFNPAPDFVLDSLEKLGR